MNNRVPQTDEEVKAVLLDILDVASDHFYVKTIIGHYELRRVMGDTIPQAYEKMLLVIEGGSEKMKEAIL